MSQQNAEQFVARFNNGNQEVAAIVKASGVTGSALESTEPVSQTAQAAGWDFTAAELKEALIGSMVVNDDELDAVAGGAGIADYSSCSGDFYTKDCINTVEGGSWCWSGDWCYLTSNRYDCTKTASINFAGM